MTSYRLMDGVAGRPGVGSSGTQPPASGFSFSGNPEFGLNFKVTSGTWLQGYWWWCAASTQDTTPVKFALWQNNNNGNAQTGNAPVVVPGSTVTSGTLTAGAWNYTALAAPLALTPGTPYCAAVCYAATVGFPRTTSQFGSGNPYSAGIASGPLFAYPSGSASAWSNPQQPYAFPGTADPTSGMPTNNNQDNLFWIDVQVTDTAPAGATYRAFPSLPQSANGQAGSGVYTIGTQFRLSQACSVAKLWHYSPAGSSQLPTECGVWRESDQTLAAGTHLTSPAWKNSSGASANPGDGWIYAAYSGITLPAGNYRVSTYCANGGAGGGAGNLWFSYSYGYWSTDFAQNFGAGGITTGPLYVPDNAAATSPGQSIYDQTGSFAYPATYNGTQDSENHWVDLEVTPVTSSAPGVLLVPPGISSPMALARQAWPSAAPVLATAADTGTGADSATVTANAAASDTGAGGDSGTVTASVTGADTGAAAETALVTVAGAETGAGADAGSVTAAPTGADAGAGADTGAVTATVSGSDTGSGADSATARPPSPPPPAGQLGGSAVNLNTYGGSAQ